MPRLSIFIAAIAIALAGCTAGNRFVALPDTHSQGGAFKPHAIADMLFRRLDGFNGEAPDIDNGKNKIEVTSFRFGGSWQGAALHEDGTFTTFSVPQYNYFMSAQGAGGKIFLDAEPINGCPPTCSGSIVVLNANLSLRAAILIANGEPAADIAAGPNGTMLFTENDNIGVLTLPNSFAFYPLPSGAAGALSIRLDSNGLAYFTEQSAHNIGKFDPVTHKITEVSLAAQGVNCTPAAIIPSGVDLFVTCPPEQLIVEIDLNAIVVKQFPIGQQLSFSPHALTIGSDKIIYGGIANGGLSRIQNNMLIAPLTFPFAASPFSLNAGPDGNIYASDPTNQAIDIYVIHLMALNPPVINFGAIGDTVNLVVTENRYNGPWTATSSNPAVCDVQQSTPQNTFKVTAKGSGRIMVQITDRNHNNDTCQCSVP